MRIAWAVLLLVVSLILIQNNALATVDNIDFFAGRTVAGKDLGYWATEFWKWFHTVPNVLTPGQCYIGKDSNNSMIFLLNSMQESYKAQCDIESKPILVPLLVSECDITVGEKRLESGKIEDFWACAKEANEGFKEWQVALDNTDLIKSGQNIQTNQDQLEKILVRNTTFFNLTIPENNRYDVTAGTYPAVVDGYYLILNPLPPGEHTLFVKIVRENKEAGESLTPETGEASYTLTVK